MVTNTQKATLGALFSHIIYGFSFMFSKIALDVSNIFILLSMRFLVAFLVLNLLWVFGVIKLDFKGKRLFGLLAMGFFQPFLYFIFEQYGILYTSSAISGVVIALVPIATMGLSALFLREKPTIRQVTFGILSLIGIVIVSLADGSNGDFTLHGFLLLVGAVVCAGGFNILSRKLSGNFSPFERTYVMMALGFIGFTSIAVVNSGSGFFTDVITAFSNIGFTVAVIYLAVLSSVVAFACYNYSTTHLPVSKTTSFANIITVVSILAGIFILGESFTILQLLACVLIVVGVFGVNKG